MGKEVVQGILIGFACVGLVVVAGNYVGMNYGHGGGHGGGHQTDDHGSSETKSAEHGDSKDSKSSHGGETPSKDHHGGGSGWGSYLLGMLLHVLWYGIPSFVLAGFVALSEYFDRRGLDWWRAYIPGYNVWVLMAGGESS